MLAEFLLARIAEDRADAYRRIDEEVERLRRDGLPDTTRDDLINMEESDHWRRPLAECEAKRRIIEEHQMWQPTGYRFTDGRQIDVCTVDEQHWPCRTMKAVASVYANHHDLLPEWNTV